MANRSNEFREADGYLHVLSTEHVKMSDGVSNPCKVKINGTIPDGAKNTIVDNNNSVSFFTLTNHDLLKYGNNLTRQIETLNKSIETLKENKDTSETSMWVMLAVGIVSLVVCLVCAAITQGQSMQISESESLANGEVSSIVEGNRQVVQDTFYQMVEIIPRWTVGPAARSTAAVGYNLIEATPFFVYSQVPTVVTLTSVSLVPMEVMILSGVGVSVCALVFGVSVHDYRTYSDIVDKEDLVCSFDEAVLNCVSMEAAFRADNKVLVDPN
jgi:hypothetical protein